MNVLSLQSRVVYGHVGHAAAMPLMERLGHTVWPIDTVVFSNHPGHGRLRGRIVPAAEISALVEGLAALGVLADCAAVASGYLGSAENGRAVLDAVRRVKRANRQAFYLCDPVMGDREGGLFVGANLPPFFAEEAVALADILVPNAFELEQLTGTPVGDIPAALAAADCLRARGPALVVVTGIALAQEVATLAVGDAGAWAVTTPRLPCRAHGTGDAFAALFLAHLLDRRSTGQALRLAVGGVYALVEATAGAEELALIAGQDAAVAPSRGWAVRRLR